MMKRTLMTSVAGALALGTVIAGCTERETRVEGPPAAPPPPVATAPVDRTTERESTTTVVTPGATAGATAEAGMSPTPGTMGEPGMMASPGMAPPPGAAGPGMTPPPGEAGFGMAPPPPPPGSAYAPGAPGAYATPPMGAGPGMTPDTGSARSAAGTFEQRDVQEMKQQLTMLRSRVEELERKHGITPSPDLTGGVGGTTFGGPTGMTGATGEGAAAIRPDEVRMIKQELDNLRQRVSEIERRQTVAGAPAGRGPATK
jgi:polyhydroxyalkanoate synthesis regulator phasin